MASVISEFGATLAMARRLNQSRVSAMLQLILIAIKFGTAEAQRLEVGLTLSVWLPTPIVQADKYWLVRAFGAGSRKRLSYVFTPL